MPTEQNRDSKSSSPKSRNRRNPRRSRDRDQPVVVRRRGASTGNSRREDAPTQGSTRTFSNPRVAPTPAKRHGEGDASAISRPVDFAQTWWGKHWLESIEAMSTTAANRLLRGLKYAQQQKVRNLRWSPGKVEAQIHGRRRSPYRVTLTLKVFTNAQWNKVIEQLGTRAAFTASLLAGEMPQDLTDVFDQCGLSLFPGRLRDLKETCTCPDWSKAHRYIAATHFAIAEALDQDPFLILGLRGRKREDVLAALRAARSGQVVSDDPIGNPGKEGQGVSVAQVDANSFYNAKGDLSDYRFHIAPPDIPMPILHRLGDPSSWRLKASLTRFLEPIFTTVSERAAQLGHADESDKGIYFAAQLIQPDHDEDSIEDDDDNLDLSYPEGATPAVDDEEESNDSDSATVLVRRAKRDEPTPRHNRRRKNNPNNKQRKQTQQASHAGDAPTNNDPKPTPRPAAAAPGAKAAPGRLSRRVAPGTADAGKNSTLESRLEMILPITETESTPNGPHIARQIVWALKTHGSATARQLARRTRLKKTAVVQILQSLLAVGLVLQEGQGERARYSVPEM